MKKYWILGFLVFVFLIALAGCNLFNSSSKHDDNMDDLVADPEFQFNTSRSVELDITSIDQYGFLMPFGHFEIWKDNPEDGGTKRVLSIRTNENAQFFGTIALPSYYESVFLKSGTLLQQIWLNIENSTQASILDTFVCIPPVYESKSELTRDEYVIQTDNGYTFYFYEIVDNCNGTATIKFKVKNDNDRALSHVAISLPAGVVPSQPVNGSTYSSNGYTYTIESPTNNPYYSIKFETVGEGPKNGDYSYFIYIIPNDDAETLTEITIEAKSANIIGQVTFDVDYTPTCNDSDGDGVTDDWDDYPDDPDRSFNHYTPAEGQYGTFMWEDLWPEKGDYDMNDLVMDYNVNEVTNASNEIVEVINNFYLRAAGAGFLTNGFAIQYPNYWEVNGTIDDELDMAYVDTDNRTVIFFENHKVVFNVSSASEWINTWYEYEYVTPVSWSVTIPMTESDKSKVVVPWNLAPFNPFLLQNGVRSHEIHLPDYPPTFEMNTALFDTADDATNLAMGIYFRTANYLPWAILIAEGCNYPIEMIQISDAFNYFVEWVLSDGAQKADWYLDLPGYQNEDMIYQVPSK
ncbi:MAG: LruC domain-containing protein [Candidatus Cloacimonetes bacterium]|nr:LruC domain-containing protein [Candidatus Cloacimonadota bacterium]